MAQPTLTAHIRAGAAAHDGCPLVFASGDGERATTLGELVGDAEKVAGALQARGIGRGDVVAVQLPGSYEGAVIQAAVGLCGAVLLPVVMIYGAREMDFVLRRSGATAVVLPRGAPRPPACRRRAARAVRAARAEVRGRRGRRRDPATAPSCFNTVLPATGRPATERSCTRTFPLPGRPVPRPRPDPDDRVVLMYTSGTTAEPKGVQHSHQSLLAEATSRVYTLNGPRARTSGSSRPVTWPGCLACCGYCCWARPR